MATDKPRFTITLNDSLLSQVLDYKTKNGISTQSKAIQRLIELGMDGLTPSSSPAPSLTPDEADLLECFRSMNPVGQRAALAVIHGLADDGLYKKYDRSAVDVG